MIFALSTWPGSQVRLESVSDYGNCLVTDIEMHVLRTWPGIMAVGLAAVTKV